MKEQTVPVSLELLAQACHAMDKRKAPNTFDEFQRMIKAGLAAANSPKEDKPGLDIEALEALALKATPGPWCVQHPNAGNRGWEVAGPDGMDQIAADLTEKRAAYVAAASPSAVLELINRLRIAEQTMIEKADAAFKEPAPKAPALPPIDPECGIYSIDVLAMENPRNITIGYYDFKVKQWNDGDGRIDVLEWWPLPISGTGTPVPEVAP